MLRGREPAPGACSGLERVQPGADLLGDFALLGQSPQTVLGENQLAIDAYFEHPALRREQRQLLDAFLKFNQECFRLTDGYGCVLSLQAVFDADGDAFSHVSSLFVR